jgi:hypothetical protein
MNIRDAHNQTPNKMFLFSMLTNGFRGMIIPTNSQATSEPPRRSENQHLTNLFAQFVPELSIVICEPPNPPLTMEQVMLLDDELTKYIHHSWLDN